MAEVRRGRSLNPSTQLQPTPKSVNPVPVPISSRVGSPNAGLTSSDARSFAWREPINRDQFETSDLSRNIIQVVLCCSFMPIVLLPWMVGRMAGARVPRSSHAIFCRHSEAFIGDLKLPQSERLARLGRCNLPCTRLNRRRKPLVLTYTTSTG